MINIIKSFDASIPTGNGPWIIISCDDKYFQVHGPSFIYSAAKNGLNIHVNVINPSNNSYSKFVLMRSDIKTKLSFSRIICKIDESQPWDKIRAFYASSRFMVVSELMRSGLKSCFISDVDSVIMNPLPIPNGDIGLYIRPYEPEERRIAAGLVWISGEVGRKFMDNVSSILQNNEMFWFIDQLALSKVSNMPEYSSSIVPLDGKYMDWDFDSSETYIWTGKGDRKYNNLTYVAAKNENNLLIGVTERFWK